MERDGLLTVEGDRHLALTDLGRSNAVAVMRKHRLAELLLVNVIGMPYEEAHEEACRWEHVMSEAVEQRVYELLGRPTRSPYGNLIPGLDEFDATRSTAPTRPPARRAQPGLPRPGRRGRSSSRICESVQTDAGRAAPAARRRRRPGRQVTWPRSATRVIVDRDGDAGPAAPRGRLPRLRRRQLTLTIRPMQVGPAVRRW